MKKNRLSSFLFTLLICLIILLPKSLRSNAENTSQNILLITIDTLRPDRLSCYSDAHVKTPNIDSLAERGVLFSRAFAHMPTTLPSHTNILLGTTPLYHGVHDNSNFIVIDEFLTLAEHLKNNGYSTGAFVGAFPLDSRFGLTQGFDVYDDNYGGQSLQEFTYVERKAEVVVDRAMDWLKGQRNPWFLWIHCFDPHQRYDPPEPFKSQYKHPYNGEVAYVDFALGKLLDYLEENNLTDETSIIFTGDHGESLGEHGESTHGYFAYNSSIWIPLIISSPGIKADRITQEVCHIDIFPTVCDILGVEKPSFLQGVSLLPALKGRRLARRAIYFESLYPYYSRGWAPLRGYIEGARKFIDSPIPEFYDLTKDFDELENLAHKEKLSKLNSRLEQLIEEQSIAGETASRKELDREALQKLRSLGYVSSPQTARKEKYTPRDDLKTLLPFQDKLTRAMGAYHSGRTDEGVQLLEEIIAERKDFDHAYSYLATLYKEQGRLKEAVNVLRQGLEHNPSSYKIISTYGIFLVEVGQYDAAIEILGQGLALIDYDPELWNYLGVAYWSKGDYENALETYQKALSLDSNYPIVFNNLGSLYLSRLSQSKSSSDYQNALQYFKKAIELDPTYASAYNGLGSAYGQAGDIDAAIFCWEKAVEFKPDFAYPLYNLGLSYLAKGNKRKALEYFQRYKEVNYKRLSAQDKKKLDDLIRRAQQE
jgi:arylsulfatase A-like enzyme/Flp pilus assembly protein TadD